MNNPGSNINTPELLESVINIAGQAAAEILAVYETEFNVDNKEDRSPLTAADMASHRLICRELEELTPEIPILSEESSFGRCIRCSSEQCHSSSASS